MKEFRNKTMLNKLVVTLLIQTLLTLKKLALKWINFSVKECICCDNAYLIL